MYTGTTIAQKKFPHYLFFIMHVFLNVLQVERVPQHFQVSVIIENRATNSAFSAV